MRTLDDIALLSPLRYKNTTLKVVLVFIGLLAGLFSASPILPLFIAVCMIAATLIFGKIPVKMYFKLFLSVLGFAVVSAFILAFFAYGDGGETLWSVNLFGWIISVTTGSANLALLVFARSANGLACLFFLSMTTPMLELFSYFKRFSFLDVFMELVMLIYRYIFVFLALLLNIQSAQTMRFGYRNFKTSIHSAGLLVGSLFVQTIEQGDRLYLSMNSRCYDGKLPYYNAEYKIMFADVLTALVFIVSVAAVYIYTRGYQFF
ncbi:Cobalt transport protein CbiQ [Methanimicrococcus sp. At1]|uniref:Cobalt transport protein CbiQ n=1 Tax=Methanimicrococcus hacksteinii TaxID=3028293 RepID=A0ABU3VQ41_9EURY|nr:cobalt ECF transporter T component CbiQ [Methanimicrococcus sp. At1]MDV0445516.1 Cobalt transport protein CbiQ [Methanimicrococcus sp. At1]